MPLVSANGFPQLSWAARQIAIACGSHGGEPEHVELATWMLASVALSQADLACGAHEPLAPRGSRLLRETGQPPGRIHNNCSGKHAAMLARAVVAGWPAAGYHHSSHPVQLSILAEMARWTGLPESDIVRAVDGCGVPVYATPLRAMALAYARLGRAADQGEFAPRTVLEAMAGNPFLVGGSGRFDTILMEEVSGEIITKVGAEGVHAFCIPRLGLGGAIKVRDGAARAQYAALTLLLHEIGALGPVIPERIRDMAFPFITNTRGEMVGCVTPRIMLSAADSPALRENDHPRNKTMPVAGVDQL